MSLYHLNTNCVKFMGQRLSGPALGDGRAKTQGFDSTADYAVVLNSLISGSKHHNKGETRGNKRVLLSFLSPTCGICKELQRGILQDTQLQAKVDIVKIDSSKVDVWGPELIRYNIETVPCFVLLDHTGNAVGKTAVFAHTQVVEKALESLIGSHRW